MNYINSLEKRKQHTDFITNHAVDFLTMFIPNKLYAGIFLTLLHISIATSSLIYLIFFKDFDYLFYLSLGLWISIFFMHFYFNGCIVIRIERKLLDNKKWIGLWGPLFSILENYFKLKITNKTANNIFICFGILIIASIFLKFLYYF